MKPLTFKSAADFRAWLKDHHDRSDGVWLRLYKKSSGRQTFTHAEAIDQALCFGWVDSQGKSYDEHSWIQRLTPRRARSGWSRINTRNVERLIKTGEMTRAGLAAVAAAKADGRWQSAYESSSATTPPADFLRALAKNKKARAFFKTLSRANVYAILYRLQTAKKPETRERRMQNVLAMLRRGETFH